MHEYGTLFPTDLSAVANKVEEMAEHGLAIYEVKIELDNGQWAVYISAQDEDMDSHSLVYRMDVHGGMETNGRAL